MSCYKCPGGKKVAMTGAPTITAFPGKCTAVLSNTAATLTCTEGTSASEGVVVPYRKISYPAIGTGTF